jgi:hypothetical protein
MTKARNEFTQLTQTEFENQKCSLSKEDEGASIAINFSH